MDMFRIQKLNILNGAMLLKISNLKVIMYISIMFVLAVSLSGCLSTGDADTLNHTEAEGSDYEGQLLEDLEKQPEGVNNTTPQNSSNNTEVFGTYRGYDFTDKEVIGLWENVEKSSDDMRFNSDYTYRYQLDTTNLGGGWRQYQWYEGTWRIEDGCILISLNSQILIFEDAWMFTKNEDGTMNCINDKVFIKSKPIIAG